MIMKKTKNNAKGSRGRDTQYEHVANFLFETGILAKTPRSGFHFLGTGTQTVAEHLNRAAYVGYALASMTPGADVSRVVLMCLFHDISEARISDLNYVHQKYVTREEDKAVSDVVSNLPFGSSIHGIISEYEDRQSLESIITKDADNIEWILSLKEQVDTGNSRASDWIVSAVNRLKTDVAKKLAAHILTIDSSEWWAGKDGDVTRNDWWVNRGKNNQNGKEK